MSLFLSTFFNASDVSETQQQFAQHTAFWIQVLGESHLFLHSKVFEPTRGSTGIEDMVTRDF